jgi:hypothetical protein
MQDIEKEFNKVIEILKKLNSNSRKEKLNKSNEKLD